MPKAIKGRNLLHYRLRSRSGLKHRGQPPRPHATGFSLIELVVVLAIIGFLAAAALPAFAAARGAAKRVKCASNMRQVGAAFHLYAIDWRSTLPHEDNGDSLPPFGSGWYIVLKDYIDEDTVFLCPEEHRYPDYYSYKMNSLLETEERPFFKLGIEGAGAVTCLLFDGRIDNVGVRKAPKGTWNMVSSRHRGRSNFLFLDLHVETLTHECDEAGWADEGDVVWEVEY